METITVQKGKTKPPINPLWQSNKTKQKATSTLHAYERQLVHACQRHIAFGHVILLMQCSKYDIMAGMQFQKLCSPKGSQNESGMSCIRFEKC